MDNSELLQKLRGLEVPPPSPTAMDRAWHAARIAYRNRPLRAEAEAPAWWRQPRWSFAAGSLATVALLGLYQFLVRPSYDRQAEWANSMKEDAKLLTNVKPMFENRLRAVVKDEKGTNIVLASEDRPPSAQPVVVEIKRDGKKTRIITFSGESFEFATPEGGIEKLEVMLDGEGKVMVVGPSFIWKSGQKAPPKQGLHLRAEPLPKEGTDL